MSSSRLIYKFICTLLVAPLLSTAGCASRDISGREDNPDRIRFVRNDDNDDYDDSLPTVPVISAAFATVGHAIVYPFVRLGEVIAREQGDTPLKADREMENRDFADVRRQGINDLVTRYGFASHPPYTTRYKEIAQTDPDFLVRATAIRALSIARDRSATPIFLAALDDQHEPIRLEACKALVNLPDERAIPGLLRRLDGHREEMVDSRLTEVEEDPDVRIAAAQALRRYPKLEVATALVGYLNERNFAIAWQSHRSLERLTGEDWNYDESAWLRYLSGPKKPLAS